jgi:hypothetical protein
MLKGCGLYSAALVRDSVAKYSENEMVEYT